MPYNCILYLYKFFKLKINFQKGPICVCVYMCIQVYKATFNVYFLIGLHLTLKQLLGRYVMDGLIYSSHTKQLENKTYHLAKRIILDLVLQLQIRLMEYGVKIKS